MGTIWSRITSIFTGAAIDRECRVLILGLDNAGKTSILYRLQLGSVIKTSPTVGFNLETLNYTPKNGTTGSVTFSVWDLGGQAGLRPYWRLYFQKTDVVIYVVDSTDKERMGVSKHELFNLLDEEELKDSALLVYANKQDVPGAAKVQDVAKSLGVDAITNRSWTIVPSSAQTGEGLAEGMDWVVGALKQKGIVS